MIMEAPFYIMSGGGIVLICQAPEFNSFLIPFSRLRKNGVSNGHLNTPKMTIYSRIKYTLSKVVFDSGNENSLCPDLTRQSGYEQAT